MTRARRFRLDAGAKSAARYSAAVTEAAQSPSGLDPAQLELPGLAVLEHVAQPVFVKDRSFRYVFVNRATVVLTGKAREELLGATDHDLFPAHQADAFRLRDEEVLRTGQTIEIAEEALEGARGGVRRVRTIKTPILGAGGVPTHVVGIVTDLTERLGGGERLGVESEDLERRVSERTAELVSTQDALVRRERLAVLGQLAGGLAHQIRNPLAAMQTAAAILKRKLGESADTEVAQALAVIREEVWEANRIITDLIEYARVKPPARQDVRVEDLVETMLSSVELPPAVALRLELEPNLVASVDVRQARDALGNVTRNAIEAMPSGGELRLSTFGDRTDVVVAIEDTGPGLTRDGVAHLFEPLVTSKPLGLGLGLSTARALVENQGGSIRVATSPGRGARFEIRLPRAGATPHR